MQNTHTSTTLNQTTTSFWEYHMISEKCIHPDFGEYITYGIHAFETTGDHTHPITEIRDITSIREKAITLVQLCNAHQLSPIHLPDVITDYLEKTF